MKDDDGYYPNSPGDNDRGYHHGRAIEKPLNRGPAPTGTFAGIPDPGITSSATSKPAWPPGRGKMRP